MKLGTWNLGLAQKRSQVSSCLRKSAKTSGGVFKISCTLDDGCITILDIMAVSNSKYALQKIGKLLPILNRRKPELPMTP
ncbi:hypothetical protein QUF72_17830 [Desulfobacterales bacterium HSG2]|nr:hypothetical protein [Desulfobacterales bacterium HSG2]